MLDCYEAFDDVDVVMDRKGQRWAIIYLELTKLTFNHNPDGDHAIWHLAGECNEISLSLFHALLKSTSKLIW